MKELKILSIVLALVFFAGCSSKGGNEEKMNTSHNAEMTTAEKGKPIHLTYETFKEKVWDFEKNPKE